MRIKLCYGWPDIFPERAITLSGFNKQSDARKWVVAECSYTMDGSGGLMAELSLETKS